MTQTLRKLSSEVTLSFTQSHYSNQWQKEKQTEVPQLLIQPLYILCLLHKPSWNGTSRRKIINSTHTGRIWHARRWNCSGGLCFSGSYPCFFIVPNVFPAPLPLQPSHGAFPIFLCNHLLDEHFCSCWQNLSPPPDFRLFTTALFAEFFPAIWEAGIS